jgi:uncharacterized membrane protein YbhN (UPF0104 family)
MDFKVGGDPEVTSRSRDGGIEKLAILAAKLLVTGTCFWYVSRQINLSEVFSAISLLNFRWAALATLVVMLQIPLVALRWYNIVEALGAHDERMTRAAMTSVTAIGLFFAQVMPSVVGEGVRAWLLVRLGCGWRNAVTSVMIDRGIGVGLLMAMGLIILLLPSRVSALGGNRDLVVALYGTALLAGVLGLLLVPRIVLLLDGWRYVRWFVTLAADVHRVLFGPMSPVILGIGCLIHMLTIVVVWSLGRAQGLLLPIPDAAVLFTVMIGVTLIPISISGWGLREVTVIALLGHYGVAPEKALLFSLCFGFVFAVGNLPGALALLFYSVGRSRRSAEPGR